VYDGETKKANAWYANFQINEKAERCAISISASRANGWIGCANKRNDRDHTCMDVKDFN